MVCISLHLFSLTSIPRGRLIYWLVFFSNGLEWKSIKILYENFIGHKNEIRMEGDVERLTVNFSKINDVKRIQRLFLIVRDL